MSPRGLVRSARALRASFAPAASLTHSCACGLPSLANHPPVDANTCTSESKRCFGRAWNLPRDKFPYDYEVDEGGYVGPNLESATDIVWPMGPRQAKFSSRLLKAMEAVMSSDSQMIDLSRSTGFTILEVRPSPDLRTAYVKWEAYPGRVKAAEAGLSLRMNRFRAFTSKKLGAKFMPWLEFRRDGPTEEQAATEAALRRWESEAVAEPIGDRGLHGEDDEETSAETRQHAAEEAGPSSAIDSWEEEDGVTPEERIRDIMRAMAEDGASEEDIRARVEAEIKQVLEGMVQESGGRGGDPERQDSQ